VKVAYVVTRAHPIGGVQIHVRDLAVSLQSQGHPCTVITGGSGLFVDLLRAEGVPAVVLKHLVVPIHPVHDLLAIREIGAALREVQPDVVAAHSSKAGVLTRLVGRMIRRPVILTAHGWNFTPGIPPLAAAAYRQIERLAAPLSSKIITVSEYDRQLALSAGVSNERDLVTVYNGLRDIPVDLRADPALGPPRLVMVARFGDQKDHPTFLRALAALTNLPWELDLIGDGPLMGATQALAAELGLAERVRFLGQRSDVEQLLARAQAAFLVTNWEGFPLSILEAMRAGLPVVATSVAGIAEAIDDGETGYLVPHRDVDVLRERTRRLLTDAALRVRMGARGRARFERSFTLPTFVSNTLAVYQQVVNRDRPAGGDDDLREGAAGVEERLSRSAGAR
jgi:glycosyltransferase involved in cell wall biosynthesis